MFRDNGNYEAIWTYFFSTHINPFRLPTIVDGLCAKDRTHSSSPGQSPNVFDGSLTTTVGS